MPSLTSFIGDYTICPAYPVIKLLLVDIIKKKDMSTKIRRHILKYKFFYYLNYSLQRNIITYENYQILKY